MSNPLQFEQKHAEAQGLEPAAENGAGANAFAGAGYGYGANVRGGESELSAVHYLQVLYRRRYIAATAFLAVVVVGALLTFTATRIYLGSARILIERDVPKVVSFQEVLEQSEVTDDYYETQYRILQSRGLARRTLDMLDLWTHPQFNRPPQLTVRAVLMRPLNTVLGWFEPARPVEPPDAAETRAQSQVIDRFLSNLGIEAVRYSRLVDVSFRSPDPVLAAQVANSVARAYIDQSLELRSNTTKEASDFLVQQLGEQRKKVESSEQALQAYRERTGSVSFEERQNVVVQRLADLNAAVTKANTARIQKEAAYNQVKAVVDNPAAIDSVPVIVSNTFVQQQKSELAQLLRTRAQLSEKLGPNHPDMIKVNVAIQNAEARLQAEVGQIVQAMRNEYEAALTEERTLATEMNRQKIEAQQLNRVSIEYGALQRDAAANRQMFEALLQRTQETGVSEELKTGNIRVVDEAEVPTSPVSPNVLNSLLIALLGGLTLAIGLAFGLEYTDDRIKNPDEVKKHLGLPFLGMVPALADKTASPLIGSGQVSNMFTECFRSIRTNVLFSSTEEGGHVIVVTSSVPGEGKTIVSANLAVALAHAGHRVLLLDADMRKPRAHEMLAAPIAPGLSNLLVGNAKASEAIQDTQVQGLWLLTAGTLPPNPAELLGSKRFKEFNAFLVQHFDWVIIDTPPIMAVTDAAVVANLAQGVLFVIGADMTSRRIASRAVEQIEIGQARFLGAVLNRVDLEHNAYYYSRYYRPDYGGYYGPPGGPPPERGGRFGGTGIAEDPPDDTRAARVATAVSPVVGIGTGRQL